MSSHRAREEFIGKHVHIVRAPQHSWNNKQGVIIDETKNAFVLLVQGQPKTLLKRGLVLSVEDTGYIIHGTQVLRRPEDRLKRCV